MDKEHAVFPNLLEDFLSVLFEGVKTDAYGEKTKSLVSSLAPDIMYCASKGNVKSPKHILLPSAIRSLTGTVELISMLNRLGHGVSYSKLLEMETALCLMKLNMPQQMSVCLPQNILPCTSTIVAFDNIDRLVDNNFIIAIAIQIQLCFGHPTKNVIKSVGGIHSI